LTLLLLASIRTIDQVLVHVRRRMRLKSFFWLSGAEFGQIAATRLFRIESRDMVFVYNSARLLVSFSFAGSDIDILRWHLN
jgi:hypothetical protein